MKPLGQALMGWLKPPPAGQSFSTANKTMLLRMQRELKMLTLEPPHGICAWPKGDRANIIAAQIRGQREHRLREEPWTRPLSSLIDTLLNHPKFSLTPQFIIQHRQWRADLPGYTKDATERFVATIG